MELIISYNSTLFFFPTTYIFVWLFEHALRSDGDELYSFTLTSFILDNW